MKFSLESASDFVKDGIEALVGSRVLQLDTATDTLRDVAMNVVGVDEPAVTAPEAMGRLAAEGETRPLIPEEHAQQAPIINASPEARAYDRQQAELTAKQQVEAAFTQPQDPVEFVPQPRVVSQPEISMNAEQAARAEEAYRQLNLLRQQAPLN